MSLEVVHIPGLSPTQFSSNRTPCRRPLSKQNCHLSSLYPMSNRYLVRTGAILFLTVPKDLQRLMILNSSQTSAPRISLELSLEMDFFGFFCEKKVEFAHRYFDVGCHGDSTGGCFLFLVNLSGEASSTFHEKRLALPETLFFTLSPIGPNR